MYTKYTQPAVYAKGCLSCGKENQIVQCYGERYCCTQCLQYLRTPEGDPVKLHVTPNGRSIVGHIIKNGQEVMTSSVNINKLELFKYKCHATFAGERGELIVLLDEYGDHL